MRRPLILILVLFAVSSCARTPSREDALMDEIERLILLPKDARPLDAYGRNYAFSDQGRVTATYLIPSPPAPIEGCWVMEDDSSRPCSKEEVAESVASQARAAAAQTPAGKRRWFSNPADLPFINDGGCTQVSVEFDTVAHRFLLIACNGFA